VVGIVGVGMWLMDMEVEVNLDDRGYCGWRKGDEKG
jgi:hypothetical protein